MRRVLSAVAGMAVVVALTGSPASASPDSATSTSTSAGPARAAAADGRPCGGRTTHPTLDIKVQYCPDWSPSGGIPVHAAHSGASSRVGRINPSGGDWYVCQAKGGSFGLPGGIRNNWWAFTLSDNGRWGWVNQVYFRGGDNNEPDGRLRHCDGGDGRGNPSR